MAEKQIFKLKTIKKNGAAPTPGSVGNQPNTLYVLQVSDTEAKALVTDKKGKAIALQGVASGNYTGPTYDKNGVFYLNGLLRLNPVYATELGSTAGTKALVMKQDGSVHTVPISALGGSTGITPVPAPSPKNKLAGKKLSFIGDSITSFGDGTPEYSAATGYTYDDVWSGLVIKLTGGVLGTLDGVAGSTVQGST